MEADVLDEILIDVRKGEDSFPLTLFSEGEKQLANLLLLLDLTKEYKALFLLDEFDSYLHPTWQREFVEMIHSIDIRGQIIFTTHSAASISKLKSENLFIMENGEVSVPGSETYNRALNEIMEEHMGITMRDPEVESLYDKFKQYIADGNKEMAEYMMAKMLEFLSEDDPVFITMRLLLRRL